jgi:hypothetical protein
MNIIRTAISGALVLLTLCAQANESAVPLGSKDACMQGPLAEFGQYIGNWDIHDSQLSKDGSEWTDGAGARWNFVCIGDGTAVQDFWMPNDGPVGTNLRIYNSETESWDIVWTIKGLPGFTHIGAKKDEQGNIVMQHISPIPTPLRRITFFPADADGWKWKLSLSTDDGESWFEVYRISASPSDN